MNCKKGELCRVITPGPFQDKLVVVTELQERGYGPEWLFEGSPIRFSDCLEQHTFFDRILRPIQDKPGNEQFVVEARKSLPRKKPVTGPVTINERGEVA